MIWNLLGAVMIGLGTVGIIKVLATCVWGKAEQDGDDRG